MRATNVTQLQPPEQADRCQHRFPPNGHEQCRFKAAEHRFCARHAAEAQERAEAWRRISAARNAGSAA